jgi:putative hydrolase of the HAD superfamily
VHEAVTGRITDEQWRDDVERRLADTCGASAPCVVAEWSRSAGAVDAHVLAVLRSARKDGWHVSLLTNATTRLRDDLARLGLLDELDAVLNSSELGVCKPDPRAFEAACRHLGADPQDCVFVDDGPWNVAAAAAAGMDAHLHRDAHSLAELLGVNPSLRRDRATLTMSGSPGNRTPLTGQPVRARTSRFVVDGRVSAAAPRRGR